MSEESKVDWWGSMLTFFFIPMYLALWYIVPPLSKLLLQYVEIQIPDTHSRSAGWESLRWQSRNLHFNPVPQVSFMPIEIRDTVFNTKLIDLVKRNLSSIPKLLQFCCELGKPHIPLPLLFSISNMPLHCPLTSIVFEEGSAVNLILLLLCMMGCFALAGIGMFSVFAFIFFIWFV